MLIIEQELNVTRVCKCFQLHRKEILLQEETSLCPQHQITFIIQHFAPYPPTGYPTPEGGVGYPPQRLKFQAA